MLIVSRTIRQLSGALIPTPHCILPSSYRLPLRNAPDRLVAFCNPPPPPTTQATSISGYTRTLRKQQAPRSWCRIDTLNSSSSPSFHHRTNNSSPEFKWGCINPNGLDPACRFRFWWGWRGFLAKLHASTAHDAIYLPESSLPPMGDDESRDDSTKTLWGALPYDSSSGCVLRCCRAYPIIPQSSVENLGGIGGFEVTARD